MDPTDGDAAHKVGTALLGQGEWAAAHVAWRRGVEAAPTHPALSAQAAKDNAYLPGTATSSTTMTTTATSPPSPRFETVHSAGVWSSRVGPPLLNQTECAEWVAAAEAAATLGGWTTSCHYAVPTTDIPVHAAPALLTRWNGLMRYKMALLLAPRVPRRSRRLTCARAPRVCGALFAAAQHHLPTHADQSLLLSPGAQRRRGVQGRWHCLRPVRRWWWWRWRWRRRVRTSRGSTRGWTFGCVQGFTSTRRCAGDFGDEVHRRGTFVV